jgi:hypothetical protein
LLKNLSEKRRLFFAPTMPIRERETKQGIREQTKGKTGGMPETERRTLTDDLRESVAVPSNTANPIKLS